MITRYRAPEAPRPGIALTLSLLALALMFADARLGLLAPVRKTLGAGLYPVQAALAWPGEQLRSIDGYFDDIAALRTENQLLRTVLTQQAGILATTERLRQQNQSLRELAALRPRMPQPGIVAEAVMQPRAAGTRRRLLNRGSQHGVAAGQPVIDASGVIGQITRVYPFSSEMTLITDPALSVPVTVQRNGLHALTFGTTSPARLELRFQARDADIHTGDIVQTSGLDFLYPPGIPVGVVEQVEAPAGEPFAQVQIRPLANLGDPQLMLILQSDTSAIPDDPAAPAPARPAGGTVGPDATRIPGSRNLGTGTAPATITPPERATGTNAPAGTRAGAAGVSGPATDTADDPTAASPAALQP